MNYSKFLNKYYVLTLLVVFILGSYGPPSTGKWVTIVYYCYCSTLVVRTMLLYDGLLYSTGCMCISHWSIV